MKTNYEFQVLSSIHDDAKAMRSEYAARGIRDMIFTMKWPNGMIEVRGNIVAPRRQIGSEPRFGIKTLSEYCKKFYGTGKLRLVESGSIHGRPTATYEVV